MGMITIVFLDPLEEWNQQAKLYRLGHSHEKCGSSKLFGKQWAVNEEVSLRCYHKAVMDQCYYYFPNRDVPY